ncbi:winged helix-turn-helix transcriptional regulator [Flavobacterium sp. GB2R13]
MEDDKLIIRKMYHKIPSKVEYSLSNTSLELIPLIEHVYE